MVIPVAGMVSGPLPELPMTTLSSTDVAPTPTVPKFSPAGGAGSETNILGRLEPFSATVFVGRGVSSVMVSVPDELAPDCGVKVTSMVHRAPTARVAGSVPQVFDCLNAAPVTAMDSRTTGRVPVLA